MFNFGYNNHKIENLKSRIEIFLKDSIKLPSRS